jgi:excisionase family DNA binding protein
VVIQTHATHRAEGEESPSGLDTRTQLAERINISLRTVDDWRERGIIPYLKIGGVIRFDFAQVMAALRERYEVKEKARAAR